MRELVPQVEFEAKLFNAIKSRWGNNVWILRCVDHHGIGIPTFLMCFFGHFIALELTLKKRKAKKADDRSLRGDDTYLLIRQLQKRNMRRIAIAGGSSFHGREYTPILEKLEKIYHSLRIYR